MVRARSFWVCCFAIVSLLFVATMGLAAEAPKQPVTIKIEGAKMPPVTFSHTTHVDKQKIDCAKCHHKDAQNPKACTTCHMPKEAKGKAIVAKDAFHNLCQGCHKEKGGKAPTKCNECHKK